MTLIFYSLAAFGLAYVVGHAKISVGLREWIADSGRPGEWLIELAECPACLGWWIGAVACLSGVPSEWLPNSSPWLRWASWALGLEAFTAGNNFVLGRLTGLIRDPSKETMT